MHVMLVLHVAICTNLFKNTDARLHPLLASILRDKHFLPPGDRTNLTSYFMKCFLKEYVKCDHYDVNKLPSLRLV